MNKITKFGNSRDFQKIRELFQEKMEEIYKETGILIDMKNIQYQEFTFDAKISAKIVTSENIEDAKKEAMKVEWDANCHKYRLLSEDFGKTFSSKGTVYTIVGLLPRKSKLGILVRNNNNPSGKVLKSNASYVHFKLYGKRILI